MRQALLWASAAPGRREVVTTRFLERKLTHPTCVLSLVSLTCGSFRSGTYLIDELPLLQL